jgi:hypothetical protein
VTFSRARGSQFARPFLRIDSDPNPFHCFILYQDLTMLSKVSLFSALPPEELQTLESHANLKSYRKNTIIIEKGDESSAL